MDQKTSDGKKEYKTTDGKVRDSRSTTLVNVKVKYLRPRGYHSFMEWSRDPNHVYIGRNMSCYIPGARGSMWRNPFSAKKYGRRECIEMYEKELRSNEFLMSRLGKLKGKELGCWCAPEPCHGDVLLKLINELNERGE